MKSLTSDWLTNDLLDLEYKQYILLGYLQGIKSEFDRACLYPPLSDLQSQFRQLSMLQANWDALESSFPREASHIDPNQLELVYQPKFQLSDAVQVVEELIAYALPQIERVMEEGIALLDFVAEQVEAEPVGVIPLYDREGYLFLREPKRWVSIYRYRVSRIHDEKEAFHRIQTTFIARESMDLHQSWRGMKLRLVRQFEELPNPATFLVGSSLQFPMQPTLLPVAKQMVLQQLSLSA